MKPAGSAAPRPFSRHEWQIAWRFLLARRSEGGISIMSIISACGIAIAVFALVATLAVRSGYRAKFVDTIIGANAHVTMHARLTIDETGRRGKLIHGYDGLADALAGVEGVKRVIPQVHVQVIGASDIANAGIDLLGMAPRDMEAIPLIGNPEEAYGSITGLDDGIAIGVGLARILGVGLGDTIRLVSPDGARTILGPAPRINSYRVDYIFSAGRYDIDNTRAYLPLTEAQVFLNRTGAVDEIAIFVDDPEDVSAIVPGLLSAAGDGFRAWSWMDASGAFLQALQMEDNLMFIVMSILVLVATSNIVSGLVMLIKNKSATIGILRSVGVTRGSILRIFFLVGAVIGITGTVAGTIIGSLFAIYIDPVFDFVNWLVRGQVWDPEIRLLSRLPAQLHASDIITAISLSLALSFVASLLPARRAAAMPPGSAIRYE